MEVTRTTVAILAAACVTAGAAGGYLATRDSASPEATAAAASAETDTAAQGVEATEGSVIEAPEPPAPVTPVAEVPAPRSPAAVAPRRNPAPAPRPEPRTPVAPPASAPAPAAAPTEIVTIAPAVIEPARPAPEPEPIRPVEPPRPEFEELVLAADAVIGLQVETAVSSETAKIEDTVSARVTRDVKVGGQVVIPAGSKARGEVTLVERGGKLKDRAKLGVRFTSIVLADGTQVALKTDPVVREGQSPAGESAAKVGGAAIGGAILGAILGGGKGAAIGAATGAGAGTAAAMTNDRNPATITAGTTVTVRMQAPVTVTVQKN